MPRLIATALATLAVAACTAPRGDVGDGTSAPVESGGPLTVTAQPGRGVYDAPLAVTLSAQPSDTTIRYTLDGTPPDAARGLAYADPIPITTTTVLRAVAVAPDGATSPIATHSYLLPETTARQPASPRDWPANWGEFPADYAMDPRSGDPSDIATALRALPSISLALAPEDFVGPERGIYVHPTEEGKDWERPVSVEWLAPEGAPGFQADAGLRMQGGWGRRPEKSLKHSFRLLFKDDYGPRRLDFPLFAESPLESFDTLVLRANYNDSWAVDVEGQRERALFLRDEWFRDTLRAMGQPSPDGVFAHLYVNGLYWGIYNAVERPDAAFAADHFGGDKDDYDTLNSGEVTEGDATAWNQLMELSKGDMASFAALAAMAERVDLANLIDYVLLELYIGNQDWPKRNWYANRRREPPEPFRFFAWDGERGLEFIDRNTEDPWHWNTPGFLFARLLENPDFQSQVGRRVAELTGPGGLLFVDPESPEDSAAVQRFLALARGLEPAIVAESARWGDVRRPEQPFGAAEWRAERDRLLREYFPARTAAYLVHLQSRGLPTSP